jgi:hypothetical protein
MPGQSGNWQLIFWILSMELASHLKSTALRTILLITAGLKTFRYEIRTYFRRLGNTKFHITDVIGK